MTRVPSSALINTRTLFRRKCCHLILFFYCQNCRSPETWIPPPPTHFTAMFVKEIKMLESSRLPGPFQNPRRKCLSKPPPFCCRFERTPGMSQSVPLRSGWWTKSTTTCETVMKMQHCWNSWYEIIFRIPSVAFKENYRRKVKESRKHWCMKTHFL